MPSRETRVRFFQFLTVGGIGAIVQFGSLAILKNLLRPNLAFSLAFALSVASHYSLNRFWALRSHRRDSARQLVEYLCTVAVSYLINFSVFRLCFAGLGFSVMVSAVCAVPPSTVVVFLLLNYRVFRRAAPPA